MYLGWYDPDKKKTTRAKVLEACSRYEQKWGHPARVALVNHEQAGMVGDVNGVEVRPVGSVGVNVFYVGVDEPPTKEELWWTSSR